MADETNTNTTAQGAGSAPVTPPSDASKTATDAAGEADGAMELEAPAAPRITETRAEEIRREAYAKATGKPQGEEPDSKGSPQGSPSTDETDEDDAEFDPENGVDDEGEPVKGKPAAQATATPPKPAKGSQDATTPEQRTAIVRASQALRYDGYTDEEIAELPAATVIRLGNKAADRQRRVKGALEEAAAIRKGGAGGAPGGNGTAGTGNGARRTSQTTTATEGQRAPKADRLDALLAELEGETPEVDETEDAPQETEELKATREALTSARAELDALNLDRGLKSLYGEFPALRGEKAKSAVLARMSELDPEGKALRDHQRLTRLIRDAAYIEFGPQLSEEARAARKEKARMQRDGQPDAAGDNREPSKRRTPEEIRRAAYDTSRAGTPEESRRAFRSRVGAA